MCIPFEVGPSNYPSTTMTHTDVRRLCSGVDPYELVGARLRLAVHVKCAAEEERCD